MTTAPEPLAFDPAADGSFPPLASMSGRTAPGGVLPPFKKSRWPMLIADRVG